MAKRIVGSTPKKDGFRMPGEFEPQSRIYMIWPKRPDNWRDNAYPAQRAYAKVAQAVSEFTPVTMLADFDQFEKAKDMLSDKIKVVEMSSDDAWCRDCGPSFLVNDKGELRACDWEFNAWGGYVDGLYSPWDADDAIAEKICDLEGADSYRTKGFVLEGGSIHVDGEGTVLTTKMCLMSDGRNPHMEQGEIEDMLCEYLNCEKVLWLEDGIDPDETNGHVDDVACFVRPGEVACIYTEDEKSPFYEVAQANYKALCNMSDAKGRRLKVHKVCVPRENVLLTGADTIVKVSGSAPRHDGDLCIASYLNFLITNDGVVVPQYGDENDELAIEQIKGIFPDKKVVGVKTIEVVYGGGNIHCITQQVPKI
ncbi:MAG: agmatine deiminase [Lachnospiraceae bacterium]|nr:agmatine deiminase [Lachnospiraceae bacterium]